MFDRILVLIEERLKNPLGFLVAVIAGLGAIFSALKAAYDFYNNLPAPWGWIAAIAIVTSVFFVVLIFTLTVHYRKNYALPMEQRYITLETEQHWHIRENGLREIKASKTFLFFRHPRKDDVFDTAIGSLELAFKDLKYESPDAKIIDTEIGGKFLYKIYWEPKSDRLKIGVPYKHELSLLYPKGTDPTEKSVTIASTGFIKKVKVVITTERDIEFAIAYKKRAGQHYKNADSILNKAKSVSNPLAPPVSQPDNRRVEWCHEDIEAGETFFVCVFLAADNLPNPPLKQDAPSTRLLTSR